MLLEVGLTERIRLWAQSRSELDVPYHKELADLAEMLTPRPPSPPRDPKDDVLHWLWCPGVTQGG